MKKNLLRLLLIIFFLAGCGGNSEVIPPKSSPPPGGFCGWSTHGPCQSDGNCMPGGCSSQVCQSKNEDPVVTTCEFTECYRSEDFGVKCGCVESKCQWH